MEAGDVPIRRQSIGQDAVCLSVCSRPQAAAGMEPDCPLSNRCGRFPLPCGVPTR